MSEIRFGENNITYSQDFRVLRSLPTDVSFEIVEVWDNGVWLAGPGYGGRPYGNGRIFVSFGLNNMKDVSDLVVLAKQR